jgi:hypothetical protein
MLLNDSQLLQDSLPFKGRVRVGMGWKKRKVSCQTHPHPPPNLPLERGGVKGKPLYLKMVHRHIEVEME